MRLYIDLNSPSGIGTQLLMVSGGWLTGNVRAYYNATITMSGNSVINSTTFFYNNVNITMTDDATVVGITTNDDVIVTMNDNSTVGNYITTKTNSIVTIKVQEFTIDGSTYSDIGNIYHLSDYGNDYNPEGTIVGKKGAITGIMEGGAAFDFNWEPMSCATPPPFDLDGDCLIGLGDLAILASVWLDCGYLDQSYCP
jgi:hypothetical protein